jgi:hypothetical protein
VWTRLSDKFSRKAVTLAERYSDGEISNEQLSFAWGDARRSAQVEHRQRQDTVEGSAMWAVAALCDANISIALQAVNGAASREAYPYDRVRLAAGRREQAFLYQDIFGNPFRPVPFSPDWRTDTAVSLARQMYEARDFFAMPMLAEALQDAGSDCDHILSHCRGPGTHGHRAERVELVLVSARCVRLWHTASPNCGQSFDWVQRQPLMPVLIRMFW